jgi:hypothetical protein
LFQLSGCSSFLVFPAFWLFHLSGFSRFLVVPAFWLFQLQLSGCSIFLCSDNFLVPVTLALCSLWQFQSLQVKPIWYIYIIGAANSLQHLACSLGHRLFISICYTKRKWKTVCFRMETKVKR